MNMYFAARRVSIIIILAMNYWRFVLAAKIQQLPPQFEQCKVNDPEYASCLLKASRGAFRVLEHGVPTLGVLPIDPLEITEIAMSEGSGSAQFSLALRNAKIIGLKSIQVVDTSNDIPKGGVDMRANVFIPEFQILGTYKIGGRIMFLPISGEGRGNFTLRGVKVKADLINEKVTQNGEDYIKVKKFLTKITPTQLIMNLEGLFSGNPTLGRQMNQFMNENSLEIFKDLSPAIEETFGEVFKQICNRIFLKVPQKNIFLTD